MRRNPWWHLVALLGLSLVFSLGSERTLGGASTSWLTRLLDFASDDLYLLLPAVGAIACGVPPIDRRPARASARVVLVVTLAMLGLDVGLSVGRADGWFRSPRAGARVTATAPLAPGGATGRPAAHDAPAPAPAAAPDTWTTGRWGAVAVAVALVAGKLPDADRVQAVYADRSPRLVAANAVQRAVMLALPALLTGVMLGLRLWIHGHVRFRSEGDATLARWVTSLVVVPAVLFLVASSATASSARVLVLGDPLWLPLTAYLPLAVVSALGWRAAHRFDGTSAPDWGDGREPGTWAAEPAGPRPDAAAHDGAGGPSARPARDARRS